MATLKSVEGTRLSGSPAGSRRNSVTQKLTVQTSVKTSSPQLKKKHIPGRIVSRSNSERGGDRPKFEAIATRRRTSGSIDNKVPIYASLIPKCRKRKSDGGSGSESSRMSSPSPERKQLNLQQSGIVINKIESPKKSTDAAKSSPSVRVPNVIMTRRKSIGNCTELIRGNSPRRTSPNRKMSTASTTEKIAGTSSATEEKKKALSISEKTTTENSVTTLCNSPQAKAYLARRCGPKPGMKRKRKAWWKYGKLKKIPVTPATKKIPPTVKKHYVKRKHHSANEVQRNTRRSGAEVIEIDFEAATPDQKTKGKNAKRKNKEKEGYMKSVSELDYPPELPLSPIPPPLPIITTGKEKIEEVDGLHMFSFKSKKDLDEFTTKQVQCANTMLKTGNNDQAQIVMPSKTRNIRAIKGWKNKVFVVDSVATKPSGSDDLDTSFSVGSDEETVTSSPKLRKRKATVTSDSGKEKEQVASTSGSNVAQSKTTPSVDKATTATKELQELHLNPPNKPSSSQELKSPYKPRSGKGMTKPITEKLASLAVSAIVIPDPKSLVTFKYKPIVQYVKDKKNISGEETSKLQRKIVSNTRGVRMIKIKFNGVTKKRIIKKCHKIEELEDESNKPPCTKSYCRLGCVCSSLSFCRRKLKEHCGRIECMFECCCRPGTRSHVQRRVSLLLLNDSINIADDHSYNSFDYPETRTKRRTKLPERLRDSSVQLGKELDLVARDVPEPSVDFPRYIFPRKFKDLKKRQNRRSCFVRLEKFDSKNASDHHSFCLTHKSGKCDCLKGHRNVALKSVTESSLKHSKYGRHNRLLNSRRTAPLFIQKTEEPKTSEPVIEQTPELPEESQHEDNNDDDCGEMQLKIVSVSSMGQEANVEDAIITNTETHNNMDFEGSIYSNFGTHFLLESENNNGSESAENSADSMEILDNPLIVDKIPLPAKETNLIIQSEVDFDSIELKQQLISFKHFKKHVQSGKYFIWYQPLTLSLIVTNTSTPPDRYCMKIEKLKDESQPNIVQELLSPGNSSNFEDVVQDGVIVAGRVVLVLWNCRYWELRAKTFRVSQRQVKPTLPMKPFSTFMNAGNRNTPVAAVSPTIQKLRPIAPKISPLMPPPPVPIASNINNRALAVFVYNKHVTVPSISMKLLRTKDDPRNPLKLTRQISLPVTPKDLMWSLIKIGDTARTQYVQVPDINMVVHANIINNAVRLANVKGNSKTTGIFFDGSPLRLGKSQMNPEYYMQFGIYALPGITTHVICGPYLPQSSPVKIHISPSDKYHILLLSKQDDIKKKKQEYIDNNHQVINLDPQDPNTSDNSLFVQNCGPPITVIPQSSNSQLRDLLKPVIPKLRSVLMKRLPTSQSQLAVQQQKKLRVSELLRTQSNESVNITAKSPLGKALRIKVMKTANNMYVAPHPIVKSAQKQFNSLEALMQYVRRNAQMYAESDFVEKVEEVTIEKNPEDEENDEGSILEDLLKTGTTAENLQQTDPLKLPELPTTSTNNTTKQQSASPDRSLKRLLRKRLTSKIGSRELRIQLNKGLQKISKLIGVDVKTEPLTKAFVIHQALKEIDSLKVSVVKQEETIDALVKHREKLRQKYFDLTEDLPTPIRDKLRGTFISEIEAAREPHDDLPPVSNTTSTGTNSGTELNSDSDSDNDVVFSDSGSEDSGETEESGGDSQSEVKSVKMEPVSILPDMLDQILGVDENNTEWLNVLEELSVEPSNNYQSQIPDDEEIPIEQLTDIIGDYSNQ